MSKEFQADRDNGAKNKRMVGVVLHTQKDLLISKIHTLYRRFCDYGLGRTGVYEIEISRTFGGVSYFVTVFFY